MFDLALGLRKAADFFEANPDRWTKFTEARNRWGSRCSVDNPLAQSFCTVGYFKARLGFDDQKMSWSSNMGRAMNINDGSPDVTTCVRRLRALATWLEDDGA